ncbi:MAG: AAA family ATPase [Ardenticatenaceae bacterium]|nr:AAA family ATPase [Ardenticatenaceae bacterium]
MGQNSVQPVIDFSGYIDERARGFTGREWIFAAINDWLTTSNGPSFFVLTGEPGSGKTAIAGRLTQFSEGEAEPPAALPALRPGFLSAVHFCWAQEWRWINPRVFAESLALQLSRHHPAFARILVEQSKDRQIRIEIEQRVEQVAGGSVTGIIINRLDVGGVPPHEAFIRVLRDPLKTLFDEGAVQQLVILVDGLDEALLYKDGVGIVPLLARSKDLPAGLRFLVTSRPENEILRILRGYRPEPGVFSLTSNGNLANSRDDVKQHVLRTLGGRPSLAGKLAAGFSTEQFATVVREKSDGNFLYVSFLLEMLASQQEEITQQSLDELPAGLDAIYIEFLERLVGDDQDAWEKKYAPILGTLAVAQEALTEGQLAGFIGMNASHVRSILTTLRQLLDADDSQPATRRTYALYHRSFADFLLDGDRAEEYWCEAREQHRRIVDFYRALVGSWPNARWERFDAYGLRHLVGHLQSLLDAAQTPEEHDRRAEELFTVAFDQGFQRTQREMLGDYYATLADLRTALDVALQRDEPVRVLAGVSAYRQTKGVAGTAEAIFQAIDKRDFQRAQKRAEHYSATPAWARVLQLCLAWEAAEVGDIAVAQAAVAAFRKFLPAPTDPLCEVLLVRIARTLTHQSPAAGRDARSWLVELAPERDSDGLLAAFFSHQVLDQQSLQARAHELGERLAELRRLVDEGDPEAVSMVPFINEEELAFRASSLRDLLVLFAADAAGQESLDWALEPVLTNPYPRYRDIALVELGIATLAIPDPSEIRPRLRRILRAALDQEGVTFTFDLPSILLAAAGQRARPAPALSDYLKQARESDDRWGTTMRAWSADAAARFRLGDAVGAFDALQGVSRLSSGFAGYGTVTLLSLANRLWEFGRQDQLQVPVWGWGTTLVAMAEQAVSQVRAPDFRAERQQLVEHYLTWANQETPDVEVALTTLDAIPDPDTRLAYIDHVSSRWAWPPENPNWEGLKTVVPLALADATTLDTVLGRLVGLFLRRGALDDAQLATAIDICATHLTTARPWELGKWR